MQEPQCSYNWPMVIWWCMAMLIRGVNSVEGRHAFRMYKNRNKHVTFPTVVAINHAKFHRLILLIPNMRIVQSSVIWGLYSYLQKNCLQISVLIYVIPIILSTNRILNHAVKYRIGRLKKRNIILFQLIISVKYLQT